MTNKKGHIMNRAHKRHTAASNRAHSITMIVGIAIVLGGLFLAHQTDGSTINAETLDLTRPTDGLWMLREYQGLDNPVTVTQTAQQAVQLDSYNHSIGIN
jgi:hypothetical protein